MLPEDRADEAPRLPEAHPRGVSFPYLWYWRPSWMRPVDRKGEPFRILVRSRRMNSILVEFEDGHRLVASRFAVRRRAT